MGHSQSKVNKKKVEEQRLSIKRRGSLYPGYAGQTSTAAPKFARFELGNSLKPNREHDELFWHIPMEGSVDLISDLLFALLGTSSFRPEQDEIPALPPSIDINIRVLPTIISPSNISLTPSPASNQTFLDTYSPFTHQQFGNIHIPIPQQTFTPAANRNPVNNHSVHRLRHVNRVSNSTEIVSDTPTFYESPILNFCRYDTPTPALFPYQQVLAQNQTNYDPFSVFPQHGTLSVGNTNNSDPINDNTSNQGSSSELTTSNIPSSPSPLPTNSSLRTNYTATKTFKAPNTPPSFDILHLTPVLSPYQTINYSSISLQDLVQQHKLLLLFSHRSLFFNQHFSPTPNQFSAYNTPQQQQPPQQRSLQSSKPLSTPCSSANQTPSPISAPTYDTFSFFPHLSSIYIPFCIFAGDFSTRSTVDSFQRFVKQLVTAFYSGVYGYDLSTPILILSRSFQQPLLSSTQIQQYCYEFNLTNVFQLPFPAHPQLPTPIPHVETDVLPFSSSFESTATTQSLNSIISSPNKATRDERRQSVAQLPPMVELPLSPSMVDYYTAILSTFHSFLLRQFIHQVAWNVPLFSDPLYNPILASMRLNIPTNPLPIPQFATSAQLYHSYNQYKNNRYNISTSSARDKQEYQRLSGIFRTSTDHSTSLNSFLIPPGGPNHRIITLLTDSNGNFTTPILRIPRDLRLHFPRLEFSKYSSIPTNTSSLFSQLFPSMFLPPFLTMNLFISYSLLNTVQGVLNQPQQVYHIVANHPDKPFRHSDEDLLQNESQSTKISHRKIPASTPSLNNHTPSGVTDPSEQLSPTSSPLPPSSNYLFEKHFFNSRTSSASGAIGNINTLHKDKGNPRNVPQQIRLIKDIITQQTKIVQTFQAPQRTPFNAPPIYSPSSYINPITYRDYYNKVNPISSEIINNIPNYEYSIIRLPTSNVPPANIFIDPTALLPVSIESTLLPQVSTTFSDTNDLNSTPSVKSQLQTNDLTLPQQLQLLQPGNHPHIPSRHYVFCNTVFSKDAQIANLVTYPLNNSSSIIVTSMTDTYSDFLEFIQHFALYGVPAVPITWYCYDRNANEATSLAGGGSEPDGEADSQTSTGSASAQPIPPRDSKTTLSVIPLDFPPTAMNKIIFEYITNQHDLQRVKKFWSFYSINNISALATTPIDITSAVMSSFYRLHCAQFQLYSFQQQFLHAQLLTTSVTTINSNPIAPPPPQQQQQQQSPVQSNSLQPSRTQQRSEKLQQAQIQLTTPASVSENCSSSPFVHPNTPTNTSGQFIPHISISLSESADISKAVITPTFQQSNLSLTTTPKSTKSASSPRHFTFNNNNNNNNSPPP